jgi:hypothetical protein
MPDQTHAQPTATSAVRTLDPELSQKLIALGFDPKAPVYEAFGCVILEGHYLSERRLDELRSPSQKGTSWRGQEKSMLEGIMQALGDRHPGPVVVSFMSEYSLGEMKETSSSWEVPVLIETMQVRYETDLSKRRAPLRSQIPEHCLHGFMVSNAADLSPDSLRVNVWLRPEDGSPMEDTAYIQVVDEPSPPDSDTVLVLGEGAPRGCQSSALA